MTRAKPIKPEHQDFLDEHFGVTPSWTTLRKKLRSKSFQDAVTQDPRADPKLQRFAVAIGARQSSRQKGVNVSSTSSRRRYRVRYHPQLGRFSCTCPDWTYKRSVKKSGHRDCKHIQSLQGSVKDQLQGPTKTAMIGILGRAASTLLGR